MRNSFRNCSRPSRETFALKSLRTSWKWSVMMKMSLRRLLLVMNHGFMVKILKLNNNLHSESVQTSHGRKKHVKVGAISSQCWLFFSIVRVLCTTNLLQEVRLSTKNITLKFWKDCVMPWEENDRVSGQAVTGFFITITRQRIHRTLCSNFWRNTRLYSFASLRTVPI